ncbi:rhodanese-like domain-containing protein [Dysgonomonas sp. OttesenSCG-928-M03]|nr:rhodanese-like domain-containing protein [Dysgonomonas sp. OttesenSCG-928-M03]
MEKFSLLRDGILFSKSLFICVFAFFIVFTGKAQVADSVLLKELADKKSTAIIDVRTPQEFAEGHIANSLNIPLDEVCDSLLTLKRYENLILVCRSGGRSRKALLILQNEEGLGNLYNGGGWQFLEKILITKRRQ